MQYLHGKSNTHLALLSKISRSGSKLNTALEIRVCARVCAYRSSYIQCTLYMYAVYAYTP